MASLKLSSAPSPRPNYTYEPLPTTELSHYDPPPDATAHYLITDLAVLAFSRSTAVYKGALIESDAAEPTLVVVKTDFYAKVTRPSDFQREANIYELECRRCKACRYRAVSGYFSTLERR